MKLQLSSCLVLLCGVASSCRQDMHDQPRLQTLAASTFFADGRAARSQVAGTVAHGDERTLALMRAAGKQGGVAQFLAEDDHLYRGKIEGKFANSYPFEIRRADLERGRERFAIACAPCHGLLGDGNGMAVQRGMKRPPSWHIERLQQAGPGYVFDIITNGFGQMFDLADRVSVEDRWRIAAYVKTLQLSQNALVTELPTADRDQLGKVR